MLKRLFDLTYSLQSLLLEGEFVDSSRVIEICNSFLDGYFDFIIYSHSYRGFVVVFRSNSDLKGFKDVLNNEDIANSLVRLENGISYLDFYFFTRKYHRKFVLRVIIKEVLTDEDERFVNNLASSFRSFIEVFDENYVKAKIIDVLKDLSEINDIQVIISKLTKVVKDLLGVEASSILMKDEKTNELYFRQVDSEKGDIIKEFRIPIGKGIAGKVALMAKPMVVNDVSSSSDFFSAVDEKSGFKTREILAIPIRSLNRLIGVVEAINKANFTKFDFSDAIILDTIADVSGVILVTADLYEKLERLFKSIIDSLVASLDARDEYTKGHSERVRLYSTEIARELGFGKNELSRLQLSAILHDIGKIGVPDSILNKPGNLLPEEYEIIKRHPVIGYEILKYVEDFEDVREGVKYHHERFDGSGYPEGLKGNEIPTFARIIAIADAFDAMTSNRPYRKALPFEVALNEISKGKGTQFDPEIVDAFLKVSYKFYF
jgi:HD-GYP domain-containing protein (c-di-GMP phosphodiesterase class II)